MTSSTSKAFEKFEKKKKFVGVIDSKVFGDSKVHEEIQFDKDDYNQLKSEIQEIVDNEVKITENFYKNKDCSNKLKEVLKQNQELKEKIRNRIEELRKEYNGEESRIKGEQIYRAIKELKSLLEGGK